MKKKFFILALLLPMAMQAETIEIKCSTATLDDGWLKYGVLQVKGTTDNGNYQVNLGWETSSYEGTYTEADFYENGEGSEQWHAVMKTATEEIIPFTTGSFTTKKVNGTFVLTGQFEAEDGNTYSLYLSSTVGALQYDASTGSVDDTFTGQNSTIYVNNYIDDDGTVSLSADKNDMSATCYIYFNVDEPASGFIIPDGTYPIDYSQTPGTVYASIGVGNDNYLQPTYYCTYKTDGSNKYDKIFMLTSGQVNVQTTDSDVSITMTAQNSYALPVSVKLNFSTSETAITDLRHTDASTSVRKFITPDGHLLLQQGNRRFTLSGHQLQ